MEEREIQDIYINFLVGDKEIGIDESNITIHDKNINAWFSEDSKGKKRWLWILMHTVITK